MALKDDLQRAATGLKGQPFFTDFIKTLTARRAFIVDAMITEQDSTKVDVLRGEARGYDFIIKATTTQEN